MSKKTEKKISINTLKKAIQSVLQQIYQNFHIIIVDDHSQKSNSSEVKNFIKNNDKISYYYLSENHGHCFARNYALKMIKNDDCWIKYFSSCCISYIS